MHDPEPKLRRPAIREKTREEKLEAALRYYATADFLTTEQQAVAEAALKR